jgi:hypothetical protein
MKKLVLVLLLSTFPAQALVLRHDLAEGESAAAADVNLPRATEDADAPEGATADPVKRAGMTDEQKIRAAALDYAEGWYAGDAARMTRALHPDLAKRIAQKGAVDHMTAQELIAGTRSGGGKNTPKAKRLAKVKILDIFGSAASVRLEMSGWIDYMHLAKFGSEWKIVNVLWELKPR